MAKKSSSKYKLWQKILICAAIGLLGGLAFKIFVSGIATTGQNINGSSYSITKESESTNETEKVFSIVDASKPGSILRSFYEAQLDCLNSFDVNGVPMNMDSCVQMTNVYTLNNQTIKVYCAQNIPTKDQITLNSASINGDKANIVVETEWYGGEITESDAELTLVENRWRVSSVTCKK